MTKHFSYEYYIVISIIKENPGIHFNDILKKCFEHDIFIEDFTISQGMQIKTVSYHSLGDCLRELHSEHIIYQAPAPYYYTLVSLNLCWQSYLQGRGGPVRAT